MNDLKYINKYKNNMIFKFKEIDNLINEKVKLINGINNDIIYPLFE